MQQSPRPIKTEIGANVEGQNGLTLTGYLLGGHRSDQKAAPRTE